MISAPPVWTWPTITTAAISVIALGLSIATFHQRIRYNPQPKLVLTWDGQIEQSNGVWYLRAWVRNYGDASARDLHVQVSTAHDKKTDWLARTVLEPDTDKFDIIVPVINDVSIEQHLTFKLTFHGEPTAYQPVRPTVTIRWRQAPFKGRMRKMAVRAPRSAQLEAVSKLVRAARS